MARLGRLFGGGDAADRFLREIRRLPGIANGVVRRRPANPANRNRRPVGVEPWEDELGRPRLAVRGT